MTTTTLVLSPAWPRWRRLSVAGNKNHRFSTGKYTHKRRYRLEKPVNAAHLKWLTPIGLYRASRMIAMLDGSRAPQARAMLEHLKALGPVNWALLDERCDARDPKFYIPRIAWSAATKFLRAARELSRLIFFGLPSMPSPVPTSYRREKPGRNGALNSISSSNIEARKSSELDRYRDWIERQGLSGATPT